MPAPFFSGQGRFSCAIPTPRDRVELFRNLHRIGERVTGIFLHWEGKGLGWVDFQTGPLLASMASLPEPGARLHFLVKQLFPEIVLQEILAQDKPGILNLLQRFWAGQGRFESNFGHLASMSSLESLVVGDMASAFRRFLRSQPELRQEFVELGTLLRAVNTELGRRGLGRFHCLPWLAKHVRGAGLLLPASRCRTVATSGPTPAEAQFVCVHPVLGHMEIHFALARKSAGFTLYLERTELESSLKSWFEYWFLQVKPGRLAFLGTKSLSGGLRSGILARLLLSWEPGTAGLHVQV